jgi:hypothetical protein
MLADAALAYGLLPALAASRPTLDRWVALYADGDAAARVGAHLRSCLAAGEAEALAGEADAVLGGLQPSAAALRDLFMSEFRAGRSISIDGLLLSRTEAGLLLHAADATQSG